MSFRQRPASPVERPSRRPISTAVVGGLLLTGVWFLLAPFVWGYDATGAERGSAALWNDLGVGVVVILIALALLVHALTGALNRVVVGFVGVLVGAWATIAPFTLRYSFTAEYAATVNDVIVGALVTALALTALATDADEWRERVQ